MKLQEFILAFIIFFVSFQFCLGQDFVEDENWIGVIEGGQAPFLIHQLKNYTKEDVTKAKQKLNLLKQFPPKDEWEGSYARNGELSDIKFIWNSEVGFINYYVYTCAIELRGLDYGTIKDSLALIELVSEKTPISRLDKKVADKTENKLVKVKVGLKHFLVPENRLQDFSERAAGLSSNLSDFYYYWYKSEDLQKEDSGLLTLPEKYNHLLRFPVETKIIRAENRKINQIRFDDGTVNYEEVHYIATIGAGKNKNIKKGMNFFVADLGEWIEIIRVSSNRSIGIIRRGFDEDRKEQCFDSPGGSGQIIPCKEITAGMKAKTHNNGF